MRNCTPHVRRSVVYLLQLLPVLRLVVHLDLQRKDLEQESATRLVGSVACASGCSRRRRGGSVKVGNNMRETSVFLPVEPEFRELQIDLGRETLQTIR